MKTIFSLWIAVLLSIPAIAQLNIPPTPLPHSNNPTSRMPIPAESANAVPLVFKMPYDSTATGIVKEIQYLRRTGAYKECQSKIDSVLAIDSGNAGVIVQNIYLQL